MTLKTNRIESYYDLQEVEVEEEELTQSFAHFVAIQYLIAVLEWLFDGKDGKTVGIVSNVNFYQTDPKDETDTKDDKPKSPDVAVVEGLVPAERSGKESSYYVGKDGPPPLVAFEVASKETWRNDLVNKPDSYTDMGILEYFTFDPNEPSVWTGDWREETRLVGWQRDTISGKYRELKKDAEGRLWSEQLQSWLVMEGKYLRLYTRDGQRRLTGLEAQTQRAEAQTQQAALERTRAEAQARQAAAERARAEEQARQAALERTRAEAQARQATLERARAEEQARQATLERARAEEQAQRAQVAEEQAALERTKVEKLLELLLQKGINPNDLI